MMRNIQIIHLLILIATTSFAFDDGIGWFSVGAGYYRSINGHFPVDEYSEETSEKSSKASSISYIELSGLLGLEGRRTIQGNQAMIYFRINIGTEYTNEMASGVYKIGFPWQFFGSKYLQMGSGFGIGMDLAPGDGFVHPTSTNQNGGKIISFAILKILGDMVLIHELRPHGNMLNNFELNWSPEEGGFALYGEYASESKSGDTRWGVGLNYTFEFNSAALIK